MTAKRKQRTITLTGRSPVKIHEDEWPVIAHAKAEDPTHRYTLIARRHADGRHLVYGVADARDWKAHQSWRGGEIVDAGADLVATIRRVGVDLPERVVHDCLAALPAVAI